MGLYSVRSDHFKSAPEWDGNTPDSPYSSIPSNFFETKLLKLHHKFLPLLHPLAPFVPFFSDG